MLVCGLALWRGRNDERLAAAGNLASWAISLVVFKAYSADTQWYVMAVDVALLALEKEANPEKPDYYIKYCLDETMKQLDKYTKGQALP